jgi:hypothetical protein
VAVVGASVVGDELAVAELVTDELPGGTIDAAPVGDAVLAVTLPDVPEPDPETVDADGWPEATRSAVVGAV